MSFLLVFIFFLFTTLPSVYSTVIDHVTASPEANWIELSRTDPNKSIKLSLILKRENIDVLKRTLFAVSTPSSDDYGKFLTLSEIRNLIAPKPITVESIKQWVRKSTLTNNTFTSTDNSDILTITLTISQIEKLLNTQYFDYKSKINSHLIVSRVKIGTVYHVPPNIGPFLDLIIPTHRFPIIRKPRSHFKMKAIPDYTPPDIRALYQTTGIIGGKAINNSCGVGAFGIGGLYSPSDLHTFWNRYNTTSVNVTDVPSDVSHEPTAEGNLDSQWHSAMAQGVPIQIWQTTTATIDNNFIQWSTNILHSTNPPLTQTVSYGDTEASFGQAYVFKMDQDLMAMGVAGISVFWATGDSGAGGGCIGDMAFIPFYPSNSPYITAVGGVYGGTAGQVPLGETAWDHGGGGFSIYNARQSWQQSAVENYLKTETNLPPSKQYNASGRGYPDIAGPSVNIIIVQAGLNIPGDGTSCSAPISGGVFALLNDLRLQNGMAPLGFLNPFIYDTFAKDPLAFNDVTQGHNNGCIGSEKGFPAKDGWDASTGVGSPNYKVLATHVLKTGQKTIRDF
eukprot:468426_1